MMRKSPKPPTKELITTVEQLLVDTFGGEVRLTDWQDLSSGNRALTYRFVVCDGPTGTPSSVIVKQAGFATQSVATATEVEMMEWTFFNEWASLQFLEQLKPEYVFGPRLYAAMKAAGVMVIEDLGTGKNLADFLMDSDAEAAETALVAFATLQGRLHATTAGKQEAYTQIRERLGPSALTDGYYDYEWLAPALQEFMDVLGIEPVAGVGQELEQLRNTMLNPGPFLTYTQGDSCPDNCLFTEAGLRLLDFEGGRFNHALIEGVYGRVPFPTCWCLYRMPERIITQMERVYRAELVKGCRAAADDKLFHEAVVEACVFWMLQSKKMLLPLTQMLERDRRLVGATDRERFLLRFLMAAQVSEQYGHLEALGATALAISNRLQTLWPEVVKMAFYPAFREEMRARTP